MVLVAAGLVASCGTAADPAGSVADDLSIGSSHVRQQAKGTAAGGPLLDHGGDVLAQSNTYAIFWGPRASFPADEVAGVKAVLGGLGGSAYLGIADQYMRPPTPTSTTSYVATSAYQGEQYLSSAPPSHAPKASDLGRQVCALYGTPDPDGIYFFFTTNYPAVKYCAWHDKATCNGVTFQVAYMPNMSGVSGCSPFSVANLGCNGYSEATQSLLDGLAHEAAPAGVVERRRRVRGPLTRSVRSSRA
jgi:hypothetical protein